MSKKLKKEKVFARISTDEKAELEQLASNLDVPISHIIRDGVRERMAKLKTAPSETASKPLSLTK